MGPLGELGALFNPGMRHEIEERKSKANRREEEGNARDGDLRIDLASGVAVINLSTSGDHTAPAAVNEAAVPVDGPEADGSDADGPGAESSDVERPAAADDQSPADLGVSSGATMALEPAEPTRAESPTAAPVTAAQARRLAAAARRSAGGERAARPVIQRPANAPLPSSKASRAAR